MKNLRRSTKVGLKIEFFKGVRISKGKDKAMEITIKVNKTIKYFSVMIKKIVAAVIIVTQSVV